MFDQTCANCGKRFPRSDGFCPHCGGPAGRATQNCRFCGREIPVAASFCPKCGKSLDGSAAPAIVTNTWARDPNDLATRIEVDDLQGLLQRDLTIQPGTQAMILLDGRNVDGMVGPGRYTLDTFADRLHAPSLRRRATVLLVDTGEVPLDMTIEGVYTRDPLRISLDCQLAVEVADPIAFFTNLLKGVRSFSLDQLRAYLYDEAYDAAQECVSGRTVADLQANLAHKQEFSIHVEAHLGETFRQTGLRFHRVRTLNYRHTRWDELTKQQEDFFLQLSKEEAELQNRKRLYDVMSQQEVQALVEETELVVRFEQKAQLRERMRRAVLSDRFAELNSEQEMDQFLREMDRRKLIADDEWDRIKRSIQWQREDELRARGVRLEDEQWARRLTVEDREKSRAHLLARLDMENEYELQQRKLLQRSDLEPAALELELQLERQKVEGRQRIEALQWEHELGKQRSLWEWEQRKAQEQWEFEQKKRKWQHDQEQQEILDDIALAKRAQEELLWPMQERKMQQRWDDERRRLENQWEDEDHRLAREIDRMRADLDAHIQKVRVEMMREQQQQQFRLAWADKVLAANSAQAIAALSDGEQAKVIERMHRYDVLREKSGQDLRTMAAEGSPDLVRVVEAEFRAAGEGKLSADLVALYERLLTQAKEAGAQKDVDVERLDQARREHEANLLKAMESQRLGMTDIARTTSHPPAAPQPPTVIVAGSGGTQTVSGSSSSEAPSEGKVVCWRCKAVVPRGARFCPKCGSQLLFSGAEGDGTKGGGTG